jgi:hypothetical protein
MAGLGKWLAGNSRRIKRLCKTLQCTPESFINTAVAAWLDFAETRIDLAKIPSLIGQLDDAQFDCILGDNCDLNPKDLDGRFCFLAARLNVQFDWLFARVAGCFYDFAKRNQHMASMGIFNFERLLDTPPNTANDALAAAEEKPESKSKSAKDNQTLIEKLRDRIVQLVEATRSVGMGFHELNSLLRQSGYLFTDEDLQAHIDYLSGHGLILLKNLDRSVVRLFWKKPESEAKPVKDNEKPWLIFPLIPGRFSQYLNQRIAAGSRAPRAASATPLRACSPDKARSPGSRAAPRAGS